jgi:hypothetical protein
MGYLTEIVIFNDALHSFKEDPKAFGEAILAGIDQANTENRQVSVPFKSYCNYISVEKSRHADHHALFIHYGNCLSVIGKGEKDWDIIVENNPNFAKKILSEARSIIKYATEGLKNKNHKA